MANTAALRFGQMDPFVIVVGVLLLVVATPIAMAWWYLARKTAPYRDEDGAPRVAAKRDEAEVIVIDEGRGPAKGR